MGGLETEDAYPYEGEDDKCSFNKTMAKVQISSAVNISSDETEMAQWLVRNGPISIGESSSFFLLPLSH
jgi:cathepsin F